jgi:hypothetical protein
VVTNSPRFSRRVTTIVTRVSIHTRQWRRRCNTSELSGELSVGDVVAVAADGEVRLAVARIGWAPVPGPLTEVRTSEHGTRPLPDRRER